MTAALCPKCHAEIDSGKDLDREQRRSLMDRAIVLTHDKLVQMGMMGLKTT